MSMIAGLNRGEMTCWCPACGEIVDVDEDDFHQIMDNGDKEYSVYCPECGQGFYVAESYYNDDWVPQLKEGLIVLKVLDRGYATGKGFYTVVDNPDLISIPIGSLVVNGSMTPIIRGVEYMMHLMTIPEPDHKQAIITNIETHGNEIYIKPK